MAKVLNDGGEWAGAVALTTDGQSLVSGSCEGVLRWRALPSGTLVREVPAAHESVIQDMAISSTGRWLATAGLDHTVGLWALSEGRLCWRGQHRDGVLALAWSSRGERLASASGDGILQVWDAASGAQLLHLKLGFGCCTIAWSSDDRWLASVSEDGMVCWWDAEDGRLLRRSEQLLAQRQRTLPAWQHGHCTRFSPDGRFLAWVRTEYDDPDDLCLLDRIYVWKPAVDAMPGRFVGGGLARTVTCVLWSPNGQRLAYGNEKICLHDAATRHELARFTFPEAYVSRLAWSPDGTFLASTHPGGTVRLWDTRLGIGPDSNEITLWSK